MKDTDLSWLAGFLEGEGCFSAKSNGKKNSLSAVSTDLDVVQRAAEIMDAKVHPIKSERNYYKQAYRVDLYGHNSRVWMIILLPLMGQRRQARIKELLARVDPLRVLDAVVCASRVTGTSHISSIDIVGDDLTSQSGD